MTSLFIFLFLAIFPFGQILRIGIFQPIDVVVGVAALLALFAGYEKSVAVKYLETFLLTALFSWIFSISIFPHATVLYGLLYLTRLTAYIYFGVYVWNFARKRKSNSKLIIDSLLAVSVISAIFGWVQFFTFPDLKPFFVWGWDMHLLRVVGTFLDPTFLGLIIVFGLILVIHRCIIRWNFRNISLAVFLLVSLAFTYSRASYLAFIAGVFVIVFFNRKLKKLLLLLIALIIIAFLLPTTKNHSIELFRTFSAIARVENYQTTLKIFSKSPIFGVGYDNMCIAYQKFIGPQNFSSHACSGSDSSLLFILATTGIVGFTVFLYSIWKIAMSLKYNSYSMILYSSFVALLVHSLFSNSFFYPWILGWMIILLSLSGREVHGN